MEEEDIALDKVVHLAMHAKQDSLVGQFVETGLV